MQKHTTRLSTRKGSSPLVLDYKASICTGMSTYTTGSRVITKGMSGAQSCRTLESVCPSQD